MTPKSVDPLDDILSEFDTWCRCGNNGCGKFDNFTEAKAQIQALIDFTEAKAQIQALIDAARVKELKQWQGYWKNAKDTRNTDTYVTDRIAQLTKTNKDKED